MLRDELQKQDFAKPVSLRVSRILVPISRFRIAQVLPQMSRASCASRSGWLLVSYASSAMVFARRKDFKFRERHRRVELDAQMNPTLFHTATNVLYYTTTLAQCGDKLQCYHGEAIFSMT